MQNILYRLRTFMYGRNGYDTLGFAALVVSCVLAVVGIFIRTSIISLLQAVCIIYFLWRFCSKNVSKRQTENAKFTGFLYRIRPFFAKIGKWFSFQKRKLSEIKTHRYIKCTKCKAVIRVPRVRGKHSLTCPKCREHFETRILF